MRLNLQLLFVMLGFTGLMAQGSEQLSQVSQNQEWVDFKRDNGSVLHALVVYPKIASAAKAVILIHDNLGLNEWVKFFSDKLAGQGILVIAPDLLSNSVSGIEGTTDFENEDQIRKTIYGLDQEQVTKDLNMVYNFVENDASCNGKISVIGFGWGGSQSFNYATKEPNLESVVVYYGTAPKDLSTLKNIKSPVHGFYGAADNRVNGTIPDTEKTMKDFDNLYTFDIYEDAGHAFMSRGAEEAYGPNTMAYEKSWKKLISLLK